MAGEDQPAPRGLDPPSAEVRRLAGLDREQPNCLAVTVGKAIKTQPIVDKPLGYAFQLAMIHLPLLPDSGR